MSRFLPLALALVVLLTGCAPVSPAPAPAVPTTVVPATAPPPMPAPSPTPASRVEPLLARMSLAEKIGQMTQVEKDSISPGDVTAYFIGSVLSGGDGQPKPNTPEAWYDMVEGYQNATLATPLQIPLLYGVDAVHGFAALKGATVFPHNVGLGAAGDPDLARRVARATAEQMKAVGIRWTFSPVVAVTQDIRWGRTYESFSEDTDLVSRLGAATVEGFQNAPGAQPAAIDVLATPKHFVGDGATAFGSSTTVIMQPYLLDQGDARVDDATLRRVHLPPYQAAIDAGAMSIMLSFSSANGVKMHGNKALITGLLKGELGFKGFVVSDWGGIDQLPGDYPSDVVTAINAGVDMVMVPTDYKTFIATLTKAVESGQVPQSRIDDAVGRILTVKERLGLFENPHADKSLLPMIADDAKRSLAREAVTRSLVLLKNPRAETSVLPLGKDLAQIILAGPAADDTGILAGGWSLSWQGKPGKDLPGTTLLDAVKAAVSHQTGVKLLSACAVDTFPANVPACIAAVGEPPYTEGVGDRADLSLSAADTALIAKLRPKCDKLVVVLFSGRPMIVTDELAQADAFVAAWLPGSEAGGIADALFGDKPFSGKLPFTWPRSNEQLPFDFANLAQDGADAPLSPRGYGLQ